LIRLWLLLLQTPVQGSSTDWWLWVERVTWLTTIVGLVLLLALVLPQLRAMRADLRRIAADLGRDPEFGVLFATNQKSEIVMGLRRRSEPHDPLVFLQGEPVAYKPLRLHIGVVNDGGRSASSVDISITIDGRVREMIDVDDVVFSRSADGSSLVARWKVPYIHSQTVLDLFVPLMFPVEDSTYDILVAINCAEIRGTLAPLMLTIVRVE
jgi:hypothetical protein